MKNINKIIAIAAFGVVAGLGSCKEPFDLTPNVDTTSENFSAKFLLVNAIPDAPSLDFHVNNLPYGISLPSDSAQMTYAVVPIASNGVIANVNIRATVTTAGDKIGTILGSNDVIYRATNTGTGNFTAANGASYTLIVTDTVNRPTPVRTVDEGGFGNTTYFSSVASFTAPAKVQAGDTTIALQIASSNSTAIYNLVKKYNNGVPGPFFVPIGLVPLGSSDVGGPRFILLTDATITAPLPTPAAGKFAVRFVNASVDAGTVTVTLNGTALASGIFVYPFSAANLPNVGSKATTANFVNNFSTAGLAEPVVVKSGSTVIESSTRTFEDGGVYTVILAGSKVKGTLHITVTKNK